MPGLWMLQYVLSAFSLVFGSLGVFLLYFSFARPGFAAQALLFLVMATAIELGARAK